jgi:hypothetical protein
VLQLPLWYQGINEDFIPSLPSDGITRGFVMFATSSHANLRQTDCTLLAHRSFIAGARAYAYVASLGNTDPCRC